MCLQVRPKLFNFCNIQPIEALSKRAFLGRFSAAESGEARQAIPESLDDVRDRHVEGRAPDTRDTMVFGVKGEGDVAIFGHSRVLQRAGEDFFDPMRILCTRER